MKVKKYIIALSGLLLAFSGPASRAQALVSTIDGQTDIASGAMLQVSSNDRGLLLPIVELTYVEGEIAAPGIPVTPADGLIIFHNVDNGISKGLWYYDAIEAKWVLYSDFESVQAERDLEDFGEMFESNDLGVGTPYAIEDNFHKPWSSATKGLAGIAFNFLDNNTVVTEAGSEIADQFEVNGQDALYSVVVSATLAASAPSTTVTGILFKNDSPVPHIFFRHSFQNKDKPTSLKTSGNVEIYKGDKIDFRFISSVKNKGIEVENLNIRLSKLGDI